MKQHQEDIQILTRMNEQTRSQLNEEVSMREDKELQFEETARQLDKAKGRLNQLHDKSKHKLDVELKVGQLKVLVVFVEQMRN